MAELVEDEIFFAHYLLQAQGGEKPGFLRMLTWEATLTFRYRANFIMDRLRFNHVEMKDLLAQVAALNNATDAAEV